MSTMTTLLCGEVSLTQMNFSDSIVTFVNVMNCEFIPMLGNCINNNNEDKDEPLKHHKPNLENHTKQALIDNQEAPDRERKCTCKAATKLGQILGKPESSTVRISFMEIGAFAAAIVTVPELRQMSVNSGEEEEEEEGLPNKGLGFKERERGEREK